MIPLSELCEVILTVEEGQAFEEFLADLQENPSPEYRPLKAIVSVDHPSWLELIPDV